MKPKESRFLTNWRVEGTIEEVYSILSDPFEFVRWWPSVYLDVDEIRSGNDNGLGRIVRLRTKGILPYHLYWEAESTEVNKPFRMTIKARGDLEGEGKWNFQQDGEHVNIRYDWCVITRKPWMNLLSPLLKPLFRSNHQWAMKAGEKALKKELDRNRKT